MSERFQDLVLIFHSYIPNYSRIKSEASSNFKYNIKNFKSIEFFNGQKALKLFESNSFFQINALPYKSHRKWKGLQIDIRLEKYLKYEIFLKKQLNHALGWKKLNTYLIIFSIASSSPYVKSNSFFLLNFTPFSKLRHSSVCIYSIWTNFLLLLCFSRLLFHQMSRNSIILFSL